MSVTINKWLLLALIIGTCVLLWALIRGCNNSKDNQTLAVNYKERSKTLEDSLRLSQKELIAYKDTMKFLNGQLSLTDNKLLSLTEDLGSANDRITALLKKHVPIEPNPDTSITTVPNEYIEDCAGCFSELSKGQQLVIKYKSEKDKQEQLYKGQLNLKDNRIRSLESSNNSLTRSYSSLLDSSKRFQDTFAPRGRLYLSWGVLFAPWPQSAGAGLMYQDKRNVIFGGMWYYGTQGHMVEANIHFPLSFRKLK